MTAYIPSLTLPSFLFENPAAAILLPVACGTAIGFSISRTWLCNTLSDLHN
jgi:benzodiazapine receptor